MELCLLEPIRRFRTRYPRVPDHTHESMICPPLLRLARFSPVAREFPAKEGKRIFGTRIPDMLTCSVLMLWICFGGTTHCHKQ